MRQLEGLRLEDSIACTMCVDCTESQSVFFPTMVLNHLYTSGGGKLTLVGVLRS